MMGTPNKVPTILERRTRKAMCNFGPGFPIEGTKRTTLVRARVVLLCPARRELVGVLKEGYCTPLQSLHWDLRALELQTATESDRKELSTSRDLLFSAPFYLSLSGQWCVAETTVWLCRSYVVPPCATLLVLLVLQRQPPGCSLQ